MSWPRRSSLIVAVALCLVESANAEAPAERELHGLDVRVTGIIAAPPSEVRAVLLDVEHLGDWFPAVGEWRVLERSHGMVRVYGRQSLPWPLKDRDYVVEYRSWDEPDGLFVLQASAIQSDTPEARDGVVRIESMQTTWRVSPAPVGTAGTAGSLADYRYRGSSGLPLPRWIARLGWRSQTRRLIDALAREVASRRDPHQPAGSVQRPSGR